MKIWDLHCDTLSELRYAERDGKPKSFAKNDLMLDLPRMKQGDYLLQCFACFINLGSKDDPLKIAMEEIDVFYRMLEKYDDLMQVRTPADIEALAKSGKIGAMLTVEEGGCCLGSLGVLRDLYRLGARMMTLTWNYKNELACPNDVPGDADNVWPCKADTTGGVTERGIEFLHEMERMHMLVDVSHLSDAGFWDVLKNTTRPFVASHSNARALCGHVRNLTDEMIRAMGERGGLIGLNYCCSFLDDTPDRTKVKSRVADMARHAKHIIELGGEDILALGSDFDGIGGDLELTGAQDMQKLPQGLAAAGFSERMIEKICYKNAMEFYKNNL
jgi:membrane dipeptidase